MNRPDFEALIERELAVVRHINNTKGRDYSGDDDVLKNYKGQGPRLGLTIRQSWGSAAVKHWSAIETWVRKGEGDLAGESVEGKFHDTILYCLLGLAVLEEEKRKPDPDMLYSAQTSLSAGAHQGPTDWTEINDSDEYAVSDLEIERDRQERFDDALAAMPNPGAISDHANLARVISENGGNSTAETRARLNATIPPNGGQPDPLHFDHAKARLRAATPQESHAAAISAGAKPIEPVEALEAADRRISPRETYQTETSPPTGDQRVRQYGDPYPNWRPGEYGEGTRVRHEGKTFESRRGGVPADSVEPPGTGDSWLWAEVLD